MPVLALTLSLVPTLLLASSDPVTTNGNSGPATNPAAAVPSPAGSAAQHLMLLDEALDTYAGLTGKTILRASQLPFVSGGSASQILADKSNAVARIESELVRSGITVVQDGPHFVRVFPAQRQDLLTNTPLRGPELWTAERPPPGAIDFSNAGIEQCLQIYAEMRQRTLLRPAFLPAPPLKLKTMSPLTQEEAVYAITTMLALNDIVAVDDGNHVVQVVSRIQLKDVRAKAPKPSPGAALFDPRKIPAVGGEQTHTPVGWDIEKARRLFFEFIHKPDPRNRFADRLLALYGGLADKRAVPSKTLGGTFIRFSVEIPLTKAELLYAIETAMLLNGLAIIPVGDNSVRLGRVSEMSEGRKGKSE